MNREENPLPLRKDCHFITFNVADWVDVFIRPVYKQIIVHSLNHFIEHNRIAVFSWCLMTNHLHLVLQTKDDSPVASFEKDFKNFTTKKILEAIAVEPPVRRKWMMARFENFSNVLGIMKKYQVWQTCSNPIHIDLFHTSLLTEYILYIHSNPVRDRVVTASEDYLYSSARDYACMQGLVNITKFTAVEKQISAIEDVTAHFFGKYIHN